MTKCTVSDAAIGSSVCINCGEQLLRTIIHVCQTEQAISPKTQESGEIRQSSPQEQAGAESIKATHRQDIGKLPTPKAERWEETKIKEFDKKFGKWILTNPDNKIEVWITKALKDARKEERKFIGKSKRIWYLKGYEEGFKFASSQYRIERDILLKDLEKKKS